MRWRQLWGLDVNYPKICKSDSDREMHKFRRSNCGLRVAVNPEVC